MYYKRLFMAKKAAASKARKPYVRKASLSDSAIGKIGEQQMSTLFLLSGLFDVEILGGVTPYFDLLCTLRDPDKPYMFLVQVKAAEKADYTKGTPIRVKTPVPKNKLLALIARPLPTYVAGYDIGTGKAYLAPAFDKTVKYPSIPVKYCITSLDRAKLVATMTQLKSEVIDYWDGIRIMPYKVSFKSGLV